MPVYKYAMKYRGVELQKGRTPNVGEATIGRHESQIIRIRRSQNVVGYLGQRPTDKAAATALVTKLLATSRKHGTVRPETQGSQHVYEHSGKFPCTEQ